MKQFFRGLAFKVGGVIIITQTIILATIGYIYINRFSDQIDQQVEEQVQLPGNLINTGQLDFNAISDPDIMYQLLGEELVEGFVIGVNRNVFVSLDPQSIGKSVDNVPELAKNLAGVDITSSQTFRSSEGNNNYITSISPILQTNVQTPRFFVYVKINTNEAETEKAELIRVFLIGSLASILLTSMVIFATFNYAVFSRIQSLLRVLGRIEKGDLHARVEGSISKDEIGTLQRGVNSMAEKREKADRELKHLNEALEERVTARTRDLQVAADVSTQITTVLDLDNLLPRIVNLTQQGFELYHVSVFLYDAETKILHYEAGTGEPGRLMKERGKQFQIDEKGLVPHAARTVEAVRVGNIDEATDHYQEKALPDTRSELAVPMFIGDNLIGVLDLQSEINDRFKDDDMNVIQQLAKQIAVAVQNAQLYAYQLEVAEQLRAVDDMKSQFLASMSHELRTPLNAILSFSKFIKMGVYGEANDQQVDAVQKIIGSADHLLALINDVLDITKIESGMMQLFVENDIDLNGEMQTVVATAQALVENKDVKIIEDIDANLPIMVGDRRRVRQIFLNLVSNACKFTEQGTVTISVKRKGDDLLFAVIDTGPGISPANLSIIFEPFQQTTTGIKHAGGTGLGLPISKKLAEAHGGRLWVETQIGTGSSFIVRLPLQSETLRAMMETPEKLGVKNV